MPTDFQSDSKNMAIKNFNNIKYIVYISNITDKHAHA